MNVTLHTTFFLTVTFMHLSAACSGPEDGDGSGGEPVTVPTTGSSGGSDGGEGGEGEGVAGMEEAGGVGESGEAGETGATGEYGDEESGGGGEGGDTGDPPIPCGPNGEGRILSIGSNIELCLPKTTCTSETCPPPLGECVEGECVFKGDYKGLATLPEAWATWYCDLSTESCHGVTQINFPEAKCGHGGRESRGSPVYRGGCWKRTMHRDCRFFTDVGGEQPGRERSRDWRLRRGLGNGDDRGFWPLLRTDGPRGNGRCYFYRSLRGLLQLQRVRLPGVWPLCECPRYAAELSLRGHGARSVGVVLRRGVQYARAGV